VVGLDGVGELEDGTRVFFGGPRKPYGSMAQLTVARRPFCWPVPDGVDDLAAAALPNPALSSWLPLAYSARLKPGETVLVLGATGSAGKLAVQIAKRLGAGRVVAAGRNAEVLESLTDYGADATVRLDGDDEEVARAFAAAAGEGGFDVILDYLGAARRAAARRDDPRRLPPRRRRPPAGADRRERRAVAQPRGGHRAQRGPDHRGRHLPAAAGVPGDLRRADEGRGRR
jgi:NADPH2:quinone reductase